MVPAVAAHDEHRHYRMTIAPEKSWRGEAHGLAGDRTAQAFADVFNVISFDARGNPMQILPY